MADLGDRIEGDPAVARGLGSGDDDPADPFESQQASQLGHCHPTLGLLAAGHGHRIVVEKLVGDVDAGCHCGPHGQRAGMEEGPVPDVLLVVLAGGERCQPGPLGSLAAHLGHPHLAPPTAVSKPAMMWQPIPSPTSWSSSDRVDMLCGHPEQNAGAWAGAQRRAT